jgi:1,2-diacylglycerol 3-alpha-glucosyltransferase
MADATSQAARAELTPGEEPARLARTRVVVLWTSVGPPHVARVEALARTGAHDITLIGLCRSESVREWSFPESPVGVDFRILSAEQYERANKAQLWRRMVESFEECRPDAVVLPGYGERLVRKAAVWAHVRGIATVAMSATQRNDRQRLAPLEAVKGRWMRRNYDSAFVGGERATAYLEDLGFPRDRIWRGFNVVDGDYFAEGTREIREREADYRRDYGLPTRYFLYVGRLAAEKNVQSILRAYAAYRRETSSAPWSLVIVGSGPEEAALRRMVDAERLDGVHWAGFRQIEELPVFYALAGALVLASISEPWGLVVNEAMASGLPLIVSSRVGAVGDLVFPGINGYVFDPEDVPTLAMLMDRMGGNPARTARMGQASREIVSIYTPNAWAVALSDCVEVTLLRKRNR